VVLSEQPIFQRRQNKGGKLVGKDRLTGFTFEFDSPLSPAAATDPADYQVDTFTTRKVKKEVEHIPHPITDFTVSYAAGGDVVTIVLGQPEPFRTGGQITVSPGVTRGSGGPQSGKTVFVIAKGGKSITPQ
jgi:hypothetical protein